MELVLGQLYNHKIDKETETLEKFYQSVQRRAADIMTATGRQKLLLDLYDRFFRNAFPKLTQKLGIVYTPVEVVDFIIHSVNDALTEEFGKSLDSKNVHILDPFTGTGTFITRLIQSGFISKENLPYKFRNEIHANELVLLAYYIAAINVEAVYQDIAKENSYQAFDGIVLTDTFQLYEQDRDFVANLLPDNSKRRTSQKNKKINVIIGNPPYSAGQKSANDNAGNIKYPNLDARIEETYAASSSATSKVNLYDSYIRAFRWASDRIGDEGIIAFVSGSGWIEKSFADGMRKHISEEFSKIYVFDLLGDIRKNMFTKGAAGEGENVFGQGSMTGIAITILIKNKSKTNCEINYFEIGRNLSKAQKLALVKHFASVKGIEAEDKWKVLVPDDQQYWINQGEKDFGKFISIGNKSEKSTTIFRNYTLGVATGRDAWCYNASAVKLASNIQRSIAFYNSELVRYQSSDRKISVEEFVSKDNSKFSWNRNSFQDVRRGKSYQFNSDALYTSLYRPFTKRKLYFSREYNAMVYQVSKLFPNSSAKNLVITLSGVGARSGFSVLMLNCIPDLHSIDTGQSFPLYLYDESADAKDLFSDRSERVISGISDEALSFFNAFYRVSSIDSESLFFYVYGLLHSEDYKFRFQNNLSKELPRIPAVKSFEMFLAFVDAGKRLGQLHVDFESVEPYPVSFSQGDLRLANIDDPKQFYRVTKMKFGGSRPNVNKSIVIYNQNITITNIPIEAYGYIVNGKPALEWVMERQLVKVDKDSGLMNDSNDYANETMNNPAYPLELFQRVITVSLETMKIVRGLPKLDID
jgi:predicted helicase